VILKELCAMEPLREKVAAKKAVVRSNEKFIPGLEGLKDAFASHMSKTASVRSVDYPYVNPHRELFALKEKLGAAKESLKPRMISLGNSYEESLSNLYKEAKQLILEGHSPAAVSRVFTALSPHSNFTKLALKNISMKAAQEELPISSNKIKVGSMINLKHPLCVEFQRFVKIASDYFTTVTAAENLQKKYAEVDARVRKVIQ
jgi:hypothetical protein